VARWWLAVTLTLALLLGSALAAFIGEAAWDLNSQGEYHDPQTGAVHWAVFLPVVGVAFAAPFVMVVTAGGVAYAAFAAIRKSHKGTKQ